MDINDFRGLMSAVILFAFLGLIAFTLMGGRDRFRDAADAPFADDHEPDAEGSGQTGRTGRGTHRGTHRGTQEDRTSRNAQPEGPAR